MSKWTNNITIPFAQSGDKTTIPDTSNDGAVNKTAGFGGQYSTDPLIGGRYVQRQTINQLLYDTQNAVKEVQDKAVTSIESVTPDTNGNVSLAGKIGTSQLIDANVTQAKLAANSVGTSQLINANVTQAKLASNSVGTSQLIDTNVTTAKIQDLAITNQKLANQSVNASKIANATITQTQMANNSIGTNQLINANVTQAKLANNSVGTSQLINANVTQAKLAANSVGTSQIIDGNVTTAKLANGAVTADKLGSDAGLHMVTNYLFLQQNQVSLFSLISGINVSFEYPTNSLTGLRLNLIGLIDKTTKAGICQCYFGYDAQKFKGAITELVFRFSNTSGTYRVDSADFSSNKTSGLLNIDTADMIFMAFSQNISGFTPMTIRFKVHLSNASIYNIQIAGVIFFPIYMN